MQLALRSKYKNPKFEYRNSKQIRIFKCPKFKTVWSIRVYYFEFVSANLIKSGGFSASDLILELFEN